MVLSKDLKIAICFGLIIGVILSVCNLCFAVENVEPSFVPYCGFSVGDTKFSERGASTRYFYIEKGYLYHIHNGATFNENIGFANDVPAIGLPVYDTFRVSSGDTYDFTYEQHPFLVVCSYDGYNVTLTREPLPGMSNFIYNISYFLSIGELSSVWVLVVPVLAISVLLGLGFYLLKRLLNRIKRAKGGA